jgi:putative membrane protein insertion efficiency factor
MQGRVARWIRRAPRLLLMLPIRFYSYFISPWMAPSCRHTPTCSAYARQAIEIHGAARGGYLAVRRVCSCHPWADGGYDPVPPAPGSEAPGNNMGRD